MKLKTCVTCVQYRGLVAAAIALLAASTAAAYDLLDIKGTATKLSVNADTVGAAFFNSNSWFGQSEEFLGANTDHWQELGVEPRLSFETRSGKGTLSAQLSGVYTKTYDDDASGLTVGLDDTDSFTLEQANIGWKVTDLFEGLEKDEFSITIGRQDYTIGTGLIVNDGGGDGGERGGWYLGMRKAFEDSVIVRLNTDKWLLEGFHIENRPRGGGIKGHADGANAEYTFADGVKLGGSYLKVDPNLPDADSLNVFSGRIDWGGERKLHLRGEYVTEQNDQIDANGWYTEISYHADTVSWSPTFSYRYAHFDGDDPRTADDEQFREIAYGFTDYGTWYQGEIAGNYPLGNANVVSHMLRAKLKPREDLTMNVLCYRFMLDQPRSLDPAVTDHHFGDEVDVTFDWQATDKLYFIGVIGALFPGDAAKQWTGGNDNWLYSMLYLSYAW
jgi:hypothetical protein